MNKILGIFTLTLFQLLVVKTTYAEILSDIPVVKESTANLRVIDNVSISQGITVSFGNVTIPKIGRQNLIIDTNNTTSGNLSISGNQTRGEHNISGGGIGGTYNISISKDDSRLRGVTIRNILGEMNGQKCIGETCILNISSTSNNNTLYVGAEINVESTARPGPYSAGELNYTVLVEYE
jgi:hypothetical protein